MSEEEQQQQQNGNSWIGSPSRNSWIKELEDFCGSDDLSVDDLRRMTKGSYDLEGSSFLHRACMNKNVTLEIVQYLLDLYPSAMKSCLDVPDADVKSAYPLHLACYNEDCPNEVIELLLEKLEETKLKQLKTNCYMDFDWGHTDMNGDTFGGTPIHYYLSRRSNNFDINIVEQLVTNPRALLLTDENTKRTPIHIIINNKSIGDMFDVVKYLVETNPTSLQMKDQYDQTPLHIACTNEHMTAKTIELLLRLCPDSINEPNNCSWLPIHCLCEKHEEKETQMDDEVAMEVLKLLLDAQPDLVTRISERDDGGELPLHKAAYNKSPGFCKMLIDAYPESLRRGDAYGSLPFHHSCNNGRPDTVEYLFGLYPESINIRSNSGYLPIHKAANRPGENTAVIVEFLLRHDPECLSKPVVSNNRGSQYQQGNDALPLHIVCPKWDESNVTEHLFDLYPEAILIRNGRGKLPADVVREKASGNHYNEKYEERLQEMAIFLSTQEVYARKAQDETAMRTFDGTGFMPLHNALYASAPLGAIKLLIKGNPDAINVPDGSGKLPFDIACWCSAVGIVKYFTQLVPDRLNACDVNKSYPLHHACRGGNCEVITYLLETPMSSASVSERNAYDMLPIHECCEYVSKHEGEEKDIEYTETIWRLLTAYPETVLNW